jgi:hypothetical protein
MLSVKNIAAIYISEALVAIVVVIVILSMLAS